LQAERGGFVAGLEHGIPLSVYGLRLEANDAQYTMRFLHQVQRRPVPKVSDPLRPWATEKRQLGCPSLRLG
jgi:hypothetical protein